MHQDTESISYKTSPPPRSLPSANVALTRSQSFKAWQELNLQPLGCVLLLSNPELKAYHDLPMIDEMYMFRRPQSGPLGI